MCDREDIGISFSDNVNNYVIGVDPAKPKMDGIGFLTPFRQIKYDHDLANNITESAIKAKDNILKKHTEILTVPSDKLDIGGLDIYEHVFGKQN